jgi:hypothetical protein
VGNLLWFLNLFWVLSKRETGGLSQKEKERRKSKFTLHALFFSVISNFGHSYCEETKTHFLM